MIQFRRPDFLSLPLLMFSFMLPHSLLADEACIDWLAVVSRPLGGALSSTHSPTVFKSNLERILLATQRSSQPFTLAIPARSGAGKTTILNALKNRAIEQGAIPIVLDFQAMANREEPVDLLFGALRVIGLRDLAQTIRKETYFLSALDLIVKTFRAQNKEMLLLVDETTLALEDKLYNPKIHRQLLAYNKLSKVLFYPFRSETDERRIIQTIKLDDTQHRVQFFEMRPETRDNLKNFLVANTAGMKVRFTEDAIDEIMTASGGWPSNINIIVGNLPQNITVVDRESVEAVVKEKWLDLKVYKVLE